MKQKFTTLIIVLNFLIITSHGQVGIGTTNPGTTLDVNGAITNRESTANVVGNAVIIPANTSLVRITGAATATITVTVPAAPNAGQRLIIYNNTTGGFASILNGFNIPALQSMEFVYSNGNWQSINGVGSTIIPYASSAPVTITTGVGGAVGTVALLGFGNAVSGIGLTSGNIDLIGGAASAINYGFLLPRNGVIKSVSAMYSNTAALSLVGTNVTIRAQVYAAAAPSNLFSPVAGAYVELSPNLTGNVNLGYTASGIISGLSIPVNSSTRILLVFSATATGVSLLNTLSGYASAGIALD